MFTSTLHLLLTTYISDKIGLDMNVADKILNNDRYKSQLEALHPETLKLIAKDHMKALEYASKGIEEVEPEKVNDVEYLEVVAKAMQELAQMYLKLKAN